MSEYQYYEFLAIDRPLDESDRQALRALSTRARITSTQFVNSYNWGDFSGDPANLMERWFDLHLYTANWGTRRLMLRVPERFVDLARLARVIDGLEGVTVQHAGDNLVFDIVSEDEGDDYDEWDGDGPDDGAGRLAALAPLRADLIAGDLRLFYLLWLAEVEFDAVADEIPEPQPWSGPLTASLRAFADFIRIDPDLVQSAAEAGAAESTGPSARDIATAIADLPNEDKNALLVRLFNAEPNVGAELRLALSRRLQPDEASLCPLPRTAAALRARAEVIRRDRKCAEVQAAAAERKRMAEEAEQQRRLRLVGLAKRGDGAWRDVETEINRRNAPGYTLAVTLLSDLKALASSRGEVAHFEQRLIAIRGKHIQKARFIARLAAAGL